jgi:hypothetical protein
VWLSGPVYADHRWLWACLCRPQVAPWALFIMRTTDSPQSPESRPQTAAIRSEAYHWPALSSPLKRTTDASQTPRAEDRCYQTKPFYEAAFLHCGLLRVWLAHGGMPLARSEAKAAQVGGSKTLLLCFVQPTAKRAPEFLQIAVAPLLCSRCIGTRRNVFLNWIPRSRPPNVLQWSPERSFVRTGVLHLCWV